MWTPAGTNEVTGSCIKKITKYLRLVESSKKTEGDECLPFTQPALPKEWAFEGNVSLETTFRQKARQASFKGMCVLGGAADWEEILRRSRADSGLIRLRRFLVSVSEKSRAAISIVAKPNRPITANFSSPIQFS